MELADRVAEQTVDREVRLDGETSGREGRAHGAIGRGRRAARRVAGLGQKVQNRDALAIRVGDVVKRDGRAQRHASADTNRLS